MHVGTAGGFADGVKIQPAQLGFQIVNGFKMRARFAQPLGQTRARPGFELNQASMHSELLLIALSPGKPALVRSALSLVQRAIRDRPHQYAKESRLFRNLRGDAP